MELVFWVFLIQILSHHFPLLYIPVVRAMWVSRQSLSGFYGFYHFSQEEVIIKYKPIQRWLFFINLFWPLLISLSWKCHQFFATVFTSFLYEPIDVSLVLIKLRITFINLCIIPFNKRLFFMWSIHCIKFQCELVSHS